MKAFVIFLHIFNFGKDVLVESAQLNTEKFCEKLSKDYSFVYFFR